MVCAANVVYMPYITNKATWLTAVRTFKFGVTRENINTCYGAVVVLYFYIQGVGSIMVVGMKVSVAHRPYCDAGLQLCCHKFIVIFIYRLFYHTLHVPYIIVTLLVFRSTVVLCPLF